MSEVKLNRFFRYSAPKYELKYQLMPFIPDYIPSVGDVDPFLKVVPPEPFTKDSKLPEFISKLGLEVLDEPCGEQSDPALLHMKLRASASTSSNRAPAPPPSISRSSKDVEKWITEIQALHAEQPYPMITHSRPLPDIDALMTEWPTKMEHILNSVGFPSAQLSCSLKFYIELMCGLLDIPLPPTNNQVDYLFALNTLFNLYLAVKNPVE